MLYAEKEIHIRDDFAIFNDEVIVEYGALLVMAGVYKAGHMI